MSAALALAGCGPGADRPERVRMWAMGREGEVVQDLVRDFERENPGIRVDVQQIPWSAAHEKLLTAFVGRSTPDVAQLGNTWIPEFAALHALEPLAPRIARSTAVRAEDHFPGIWATNVIDGVPYGIPWYVDTRVLVYRTDLFGRAGFDSIPGDWAGWRRAMLAVKREVGSRRYAILLPANEWTVPVVLGLQAGSPLLEEGGTRGAFEGAQFREAFRYYIGLFREGLAPPLTNSEIANLYQEFERGTFAMFVAGPWMLGELDHRLPPAMKDSWTTSPMPGPTGGSSGVSTAGGSSLVLFRASRHRDAAWRLIEFLSRPEQQRRFYAACGDLPAVRAAWDSPELTRDRRMAAFRTQLERTRPTPTVPEWESVANRLQEHVERAVRGVVPPDSALAGLDRDVDRMLEKRRWLLERSAAHAGLSAR